MSSTASSKKPKDALAKLLKVSEKQKYEAALDLALRALQFPAYQREYRFDSVRLWRLDFAWPERKVAVEVEGGIWRRGGGAHSHPTNILRDIEKHNAYTLAGWKVYRVTGEMVKQGTAVDLLQKVFV